LIDGERVIGANDSGVVDMSLLPQMLIQRVDVVTGGASASWGSDAVAGVVNVVTDKKFEGFKVDASYGPAPMTTTKLPPSSWRSAPRSSTAAAHIEAAVEYENDEGIVATGSPNNNFGCREPGGRTMITSVLVWRTTAALLPRQPARRKSSGPRITQTSTEPSMAA
jgi:iron complex outermembrane receptor protein